MRNHAIKYPFSDMKSNTIRNQLKDKNKCLDMYETFLLKFESQPMCEIGSIQLETVKKRNYA